MEYTNIVEIIVALMSIVIAFLLGKEYTKWKERSRVSRPKTVKENIAVKKAFIVKQAMQAKEIPEKELRKVLNSSVNIISPTQLNETRNFVKNLTNES